MTLDELWKSALGEIEVSVSKAQFNTWFQNTSILSYENGKVIISVPNGFAKEWLENKYNTLLLHALGKNNKEIKEISCHVIQDSSSQKPTVTLDAVSARSKNVSSPSIFKL